MALPGLTCVCRSPIEVVKAWADEHTAKAAIAPTTVDRIRTGTLKLVFMTYPLKTTNQNAVLTLTHDACQAATGHQPQKIDQIRTAMAHIPLKKGDNAAPRCTHRLAQRSAARAD